MSEPRQTSSVHNIDDEDATAILKNGEPPQHLMGALRRQMMPDHDEEI